MYIQELMAIAELEEDGATGVAFSCLPSLSLCNGAEWPLTD